MMRLPWQRGDEPDENYVSEATKARERAERELKAVKEQTPMYRDLMAALAAVTSRNHLGDALAHNFRGGRSQ